MWRPSRGERRLGASAKLVRGFVVFVILLGKSISEVSLINRVGFAQFLNAAVVVSNRGVYDADEEVWVGFVEVCPIHFVLGLVE